MLRLSALLILCSLALASEWRERKSDEGITVSTRETTESRIDEFRAIGRVDAPIAQIESLIGDVTLAPVWVKYCGEGRLLKRLNDAQTLTHTLNTMPWPLADRDSIVLNSREAQPNGAVKITFESRPETLPQTPGIVRITLLRGFWLIEPDGDASKVTYQVLSDPGHIPSWVVNMGIVDQPFETLKNLRRVMASDER